VLDLQADITGLRGADYNPRHITPADLETLAESIKTLGLVKPLIVRKDLLVAGHQRTKALRKLGIDRAAVFRLGADTTVYDEIRFNQLHNGTDMDSGDEEAIIAGGFDSPGFKVVPPSRIIGNHRARLANVRAEICRMITKFGPWGGVVATMDGVVIHAAQYALAAAVTRTPLTVHVLPPEKVAAAHAFLGKTYGVFSYDHLERHTYVQTLAQMNRLRESDNPDGRTLKSTLYETLVIPYAVTHRAERFLDFGSGHGDYAAAMRGRGYRFHDVELFRRSRTTAIDMRAVNGMIDTLCADLSAYGPYDNVILDSVLNSVDSPAAEDAVLTCVNAFTRDGGTVFFSGRPREEEESRNRMTKLVGRGGQRYVEFLDEHGFTALYRQGKWFYQKFHSAQQVKDLAARFGFRITKHVHKGCSWQVQAVKTETLPAQQIADAFAFEFNLPVSDTRRLGRHEDVQHAYAQP
jgi:ParB family chromosome partitioning protein